MPVIGFDAHAGVEREAVGENAAFEVAAEFALGQCRGMAATAVVVQRQAGGKVRWDDAVENRAFVLAPVVNGRRTAPELERT